MSTTNAFGTLPAEMCDSQIREELINNPNGCEIKFPKEHETDAIDLSDEEAIKSFAASAPVGTTLVSNTATPNGKLYTRYESTDKGWICTDNEIL